MTTVLMKYFITLSSKRISSRHFIVDVDVNHLMIDFVLPLLYKRYVLFTNIENGIDQQLLQ